MQSENESTQPQPLQTGGRADQTPHAPKRTAEQQAVIDSVARTKGKDWAEQHAELIIGQAESIGNL